MRAFLTHLFGSNARRERTDRLLKAISDQARQPVFYEALGVPDTLDGRFDMMVLHGFMVFRPLFARGKRERDLAQDTTDLMFSAFDDAIRAIGVGDMGVPKRVKAMARAYLGRAGAYGSALDAQDRAALAEAIQRNVYRDVDTDPAFAGALADYVLRETARLTDLPTENFEAGQLGFGLPEAA